MNKHKVGVVGASGRMGQQILDVLIQHHSLEPYLGISRKNQMGGFKYFQADLSGPYTDQVDVWIDFSLPEALDQVIKMIKEQAKPLVCGTTGLSSHQFVQLRELSQHVPVLWSANMGIGINLILKLIENLNVLNDFDFQVEEIHHNKKKDKPSGTALVIQTKLVESLGRKNIPEPVAIRGGGIFGDHRVLAMSDDEVLSIEHRALNRKVFAKGAVQAVEWLLKQKPGFYSMEDLLFTHSNSKN